MTIQQNLLSSGGINWLNKLTGNAVGFPLGWQRLATDTNGNVYTALFFDGTYQTIAVNKYDGLGNLVWTSTAVNVPVGSFGFGAIGVDSSNNIYITGRINITSANAKIILFKWNSSGAFQFGNLYGLTSLNITGTGLCFDSSNNIFISGIFESGSTNNTIGYAFILKTNSSGSLLWSTGLSGANTAQPFAKLYGIACDSSNNVYAVGSANDFTASNAYNAAVLVKYNSSGTQQWKRRFYLSSGSPVNIYGTGIGLTIDSNDNIYTSGVVFQVSPNVTHGFIAKYNTSGTLQTYINPTTTYGSLFPLWYSLTRDTNNNIYAITDRGAIAAFTSSLSLLWSTSCQQAGGFLDVASIIYSSGGNIYVCGGSIIADLPSNGTKTGSYTVGGTSFVYSTNTIGNSSISPTEEASSLVTGSPSFTTASYSTTSSFSSSVNVLYI